MLFIETKGYTKFHNSYSCNFQCKNCHFCCNKPDCFSNEQIRYQNVFLFNGGYLHKHIANEITPSRNIDSVLQ